MDDLQSLSPKERVEAIWRKMNARSDTFSAPLLHSSQLHILSASLLPNPSPSPSSINATISFHFTNPLFWSNSLDNLHGGAQATLFDICTSLVLCLFATAFPTSTTSTQADARIVEKKDDSGYEGWLYGGVTRSLSVRYLRPAPSSAKASSNDEPEDGAVGIDCEAVHVGKKMALVKGSMYRVKDGLLVSTCEHEKVNVGRNGRARL